MIETPYKNVVFSMLSAAGEPLADTTDYRLDAGGWVDYPIPPEVGKGGYEVLELALGMTLVRSACEFSAAVAGQWLPFLKSDAEFKEATFHALTMRGIRGSVKEDFPPAHLAVSPGMDLFRHTTQYRVTYTADASFSGEVHHLAVSRSILNQLIGPALAGSLLERLSIVELPSISVHAIPLHVSQLLVNAGSSLFTGQTRKLYCQAKLLEYLAAMVQHVGCGPGDVPEPNQQAKQRAREIHDTLVSYQGKFPTLDDLARQYGRSAKSLNDEFCAEFGQSIYSFFADHRLSQAHAALQQSKISIKQLAARLGYAHVSNFTIAFKRKFGYPPGSLRKT